MRWKWFVVFGLATCVAYSSSVRAPFEYDDLPAIQQNPSIRSLVGAARMLDAPSQSPVSGRPVANFSFAINYAINEQLGIDQRPDPAGPYKTVGYHLGNILIH